MKEITVYYSKKRSLWHILMNHIMTLITMSFLLYLSKESTWWLFFCGSIAILFLFVVVGNALNKAKNIFKSKEDLIDWANNLKEDL